MPSQYRARRSIRGARSAPRSHIARLPVRLEPARTVTAGYQLDDDPNVERELHDLRRFLPGNIAMIVGGRAAEYYHAALDATGAILAKDLAQLQVELAKIRSTRP